MEDVGWFISETDPVMESVLPGHIYEETIITIILVILLCSGTEYVYGCDVVFSRQQDRLFRQGNLLGY